ncbi:uncharacterized protein PHACADRAFT_29586 [Phanerochaete carnosa HHB-10118-sp]|uniref:Uncharacterized protein n=1 Tax=Phanerochaete carnosa (strain HHB-10118-sp) TaxID=650164 RepID=K5WVC0_PHACS|nr:uncharacterized protein PHACADRAFT_29586 [Phanerochaete carnosa HHB-10118-sp]EKM54367.1 hypothetical protein PHACADRAFT_29586 [Phanerochaete carnosa HHB-10118-sp]
MAMHTQALENWKEHQPVFELGGGVFDEVVLDETGHYQNGSGQEFIFSARDSCNSSISEYLVDKFESLHYHASTSLRKTAETAADLLASWSKTIKDNAAISLIISAMQDILDFNRDNNMNDDRCDDGCDKDLDRYIQSAAIDKCCQWAPYGTKTVRDFS